MLNFHRSQQAPLLALHQLLQVCSLFLYPYKLILAPGAIKQPTMAEYTEARKYLKYAMSAIDFEDTKAVIDNVRKVLNLMEA